MTAISQILDPADTINGDHDTAKIGTLVSVDRCRHRNYKNVRLRRLGTYLEQAREYYLHAATSDNGCSGQANEPSPMTATVLNSDFSWTSPAHLHPLIQTSPSSN